jgi:hypothetical protein
VELVMVDNIGNWDILVELILYQKKNTITLLPAIDHLQLLKNQETTNLVLDKHLPRAESTGVDWVALHQKFLF